MASISSISNNSNAWATMAAERKAKLFAKTDTDGNGGVDSTELQALMDKVSERTGVTNGNTAADLVSQLDTNSDGSLNADELQKGIPSIVPLPSTMDFAQTRNASSSDTTTGTTITTTVTTTTTISGSNDSDSDAFASLDSDGDGKLSKAEFEAGKPHGAGGPPPGAPPPAGASSSDTTTYDPLDTNKDGIVSAAEAAAGAAASTTSTDSTLEALLKAIDTDKDGKLSNTEADAFAKQVSTAVETLQKASSTSSSGTDSIDLNQLAQQLLKQYAAIAAGSASKTTGSTFSVTA